MRSIHNLVFREQPGRSPESVEQGTIDLIRSPVDEGLAVIGDRTEQGFAAWTVPIDVRAVDLPWLKLTEAGRQAAQAIPLDDGGTSPDHTVKQWDWPLADAARPVLIYGTVDWIELGQIHWRVKEADPDEPAPVVQQRTLELTRRGRLLARSIEAQVQQ